MASNGMESLRDVNFKLVYAPVALHKDFLIVMRLYIMNKMSRLSQIDFTVIPPNDLNLMTLKLTLRS